MNIHGSRRLFLAAAMLGVVALFAAGLFVALTVRSAVADPAGPVPNPGHAWWDVQGHSVVPGAYCVGTTDSNALELQVNNERALRLEPGGGTPNLIGGYSGNSVTDGAIGATIAGGGDSWAASRVTDHYGTVGGGVGNLAGDDVGTTNDAWSATVSGGYGNEASADGATIGGGGRTDPEDPATGNRVTDGGGTVSGGGNNQAGNANGDPQDAGGATVGGGAGNLAEASYATIAGGENNSASGWASVGGGALNTASGDRATVGGGEDNTASGYRATVSGGDSNTASGIEATVGGGGNNTANAHWATIAGGGSSDPALGNRVTDEFSTVGGGSNNQAGDAAGDPDDAPYNTVSGGEGNVALGGWYDLFSDRWFGHATIGGGYGNEASGWASTVGGGESNSASGGHATVGGGSWNTASGSTATVSGGLGNEAVAFAATIAGGGESTPGDPATRNRVTDEYGTIGGGGNNQAGNADGDPGNTPYATVGGGFWNTASGGRATVGGGGDNTASGDEATVGGGSLNNASGYGATIGGGYGNTASAAHATVPGGSYNTAAGDVSFAAGYRAKIDPAHNGSFVFGDENEFDFDSAAANEFAVRSTGGSRIVTGIDGSGIPDAGVKLDPDDNAWEVLSDRDAKENFVVLDAQDVLNRLAGIPITEWNYKTQDPSNRHIGPMAQDFYAAFGLSADELYISPIDTDGVALAAIQALYELSQEQDARIQDLEARVAALEGGAPVDDDSAGPLASITPAGWLLFGALFVGGLLLVQRRRAGGRR